MIRFTLLAFFVALSLPVSGQNARTHHSEPVAVTPQEVCSFITSRMAAAVPQTPTLCAGETDAPGYVDINIVSPSEVLEGSMRRAWASALFQTLEATAMEPALNGACSSSPICRLSISDSSMALHALHYEMFLDSRTVSGLDLEVKEQNGAPLSDPWYLTWWEALLAGKTADHPQSAENAADLGKMACDEYARTVSRRFQAFNKPLPTCSVMLATARKLYIVLDYSDALDVIAAGNGVDLAKSIGRALDDTGYDGQVIVRSPWFASTTGNERAFRTYPLRDLEFVYEEIQSGSRKEADADLLIATRYLGNGQTDADHLQPAGSDGVEFRTVGLVRVVPDHDASSLIYTTDGAEWRAPNQSLRRCEVVAGSELNILLVPGQKPSLSVDLASGPPSCKVEAEFVRGW